MNSDEDTLRDEYPEDLIKSGVRGKYAKNYREGTNVVLIDPTSRRFFPIPTPLIGRSVNTSRRNERQPNRRIDTDRFAADHAGR